MVGVAQTEQLLTVMDVASLLKCSKRQVCRLADSGRMPAPVRVGRLVRWRSDELAGWIRDGCRMDVEHCCVCERGLTQGEISGKGRGRVWCEECAVKADLERGEDNDTA